MTTTDNAVCKVHAHLPEADPAREAFEETIALRESSAAPQPRAAKAGESRLRSWDALPGTPIDQHVDVLTPRPAKPWLSSRCALAV